MSAKPTKGRIVLYRSGCNDEEWPAIILSAYPAVQFDVTDDRDTERTVWIADLCVFSRSGTQTIWDAHEGDRRGQWKWPPRGDS